MRYAHNLEFHYGLRNGKRSENRARVTLPLARPKEMSKRPAIYNRWNDVKGSERRNVTSRVAAFCKNTRF